MGRPRGPLRGMVDNNGVPFQLSPEDYDLLNYNYHTNKKGYLSGWINGSLWKLHQLVAFRMGQFTAEKTQIDHINRNKRDNRRENLRFTSNAANIINQDRTPKTSGYVGISMVPNAVNPSFRATFRKERKCFKTAEEALAWRAEKERLFWEKENKG